MGKNLIGVRTELLDAQEESAVDSTYMLVLQCATWHYTPGWTQMFSYIY